MNWAQVKNRREEAAARPLEVNVYDQAHLLADLETRLIRGRGFSVATLNLDHVVKLQRDTVFREAYAQHSHITADGNPIVWLERLSGKRVALVPGSDLIPAVVALAARLQLPISVVGATDQTLAAAIDTLTSIHANLRVGLQYAPTMGFNPMGQEADAIIEQLRQKDARIVFLALGAPRQEIFAARAQAALPQIGFLSIGAGLDFLAGTQMRAPPIMRKLALEWLWRLAASPRRLAGRYAACIAVLPAALWSAVHTRRNRAEGTD